MCLLSFFRQYTVTWCLGLRGVVIPHHRQTVPPPPSSSPCFSRLLTNLKIFGQNVHDPGNSTWDKAKKNYNINKQIERKNEPTTVVPERQAKCALAKSRVVWLSTLGPID